MKLKFLAKTLAAVIIAGASAFAAHAQNGTLTPYSRFGYGMLRDNATSAQRSMGGIGYAMNSGRQINVMNPASYARIDSLTFLFDMGVDFTSVWMNEEDVNENHIGGGLDYINMQFPLGRYMGASVGVLPYSSVGYSFGNSIDNGSEAREGGGSINMLYLGGAQGTVFPLPGHLVREGRRLTTPNRKISQESARSPPKIRPLCIFSYSMWTPMVSSPRLL